MLPRKGIGEINEPILILRVANWDRIQEAIENEHTAEQYDGYKCERCEGGNENSRLHTHKAIKEAGV